jgi:hypothetical protein
MKAVQAQRIHVMDVQSMHDWMTLKVGRTGKIEVRDEHLNIEKSLPSLADTTYVTLVSVHSANRQSSGLPLNHLID